MRRLLLLSLLSACATSSTEPLVEPTVHGNLVLVDAVVEGIFARCVGVDTVRRGRGAYVVTNAAGVVVDVEADDERDGDDVAVTVVARASDGRENAVLRREGSMGDEAMWRGNGDLCVDAFRTPAPVAVDTVAFLFPAFSTVGSLRPRDGGGVGFVVDDRELAIVGAVRCAVHHHALERAPWPRVDLEIALDLDDHGATLHRWRRRARLGAGDCDAGLRKDGAALAAQLLDEVRPLLAAGAGQ